MGTDAGGEDAETVTEAVARLQAEGYDTNFQIVEGVLEVDGEPAPALALESLDVEEYYRFEGPSDPGDEMVVFALHDPASGRRGVLASAFGAGADPELADMLATLHGKAED